ncbi:MAG: hypothetical protein FJ044_00765 [Candidatus Cloacimonetes bacterium]|nr:hypothetical protein [Candidatus Cloacimonadota bacterium]
MTSEKLWEKAIEGQKRMDVLRLSESPDDVSALQKVANDFVKTLLMLFKLARENW